MSTSKRMVKAWLYELLARVELAEDVTGVKADKGASVEITINFHEAPQ